MKKFWTISCLVLGLVACDRASKNEQEEHKETERQEKVVAVPQTDVAFKQNYAVAPEMESYPIYEIGELIKNLMLEQNQPRYEWDHLANDAHIQWTTSGYEERLNPHTNTVISNREGLVRVHVRGERVSVLRERNYEAPWQILYLGQQAKWGVESIELNPTGDFQEFPDPVPSLKQQKIGVEQVCESKNAGERTVVYLLTAKNKNELYLVDQTSSGSAGASRWLSLSLQDKSTEWCPDDGAASASMLEDEN